LKRFLVAFFALSVLAAPAFAGRWVQKEIKWRISSVGAPWSATAIYVRDTTYNALGGGASDVGDTTADFSLSYAEVPIRGMGGPSTSSGGITLTTGTGTGPVYQPDSTTVAWIVIVSDTTVAATPTATNITMLIDGRVGAFGPPTTLARGWVRQDSTFINGAAAGTMATGDQSYAVPIRTITNYGNVFRWDRLRARISPATGTVQGARVFVRYWTNSDVDADLR
jgi:hypothetical protein